MRSAGAASGTSPPQSARPGCQTPCRADEPAHRYWTASPGRHRSARAVLAAGVSVCANVLPACPACPPGFFPGATRSEVVFFKPSEDGSLLEFLLFLDACPSSSLIRKRSLSTSFVRTSTCPCPCPCPCSALAFSSMAWSVRSAVASGCCTASSLT